jgi:hypothetical protein
MDLKEEMRKDRDGEINNRKSRLARDWYASELTDRCRSVYNGSKKRRGLVRLERPRLIAPPPPDEICS